MLRSKKEVDRHVKEIFAKMTSHTDVNRNLKGYTIARLYYNIKEYGSARRYLAEFLSVRPRSPEGHKLLGQIYEELDEKKKALLSYKTSYEIMSSQKELVLKICDLYAHVEEDINVAMYWIELGEKLYPQHENISMLKHLVLSKNGGQSKEQMEIIYLGEVRKSPSNVNFHLALLEFYIDWSIMKHEKIKDAYHYIGNLEPKEIFPNSNMWYLRNLQVLQSYEKINTTILDRRFDMFYLLILDRLICTRLIDSMSLRFDSNYSQKDAMLHLSTFDTRINKALSKYKEGPYLKHMICQNYFYFACHLSNIGQKEASSNLNNINIMVGILLLLSLHEAEMEESEIGFENLKKAVNHRKIRISQAGHMLNRLAGTDKLKFLSKARELASSKGTAQTICNMLFGTESFPTEGYFMTNSSFSNTPLQFPTMEVLFRCDSQGMSSSFQVNEKLNWNTAPSEVTEEEEYNAPCDNSFISSTQLPVNLSIPRLSSTPFHDFGSPVIRRQLEQRRSPDRQDVQVKMLMDMQQKTVKALEEQNAQVKAQSEMILSLSQSRVQDLKESVGYYRNSQNQLGPNSLVPLHAHMTALDNMMKDLQIDVRSIATEISELRARQTVEKEEKYKREEQTETHVPLAVTNSVLPNALFRDYMNCYSRPPVPGTMISPGLFASVVPPFPPPVSQPAATYPISIPTMKPQISPADAAAMYPNMKMSAQQMVSTTIPLPSTMRGGLQSSTATHPFQIPMPHFVYPYNTAGNLEHQKSQEYEGEDPLADFPSISPVNQDFGSFRGNDLGLMWKKDSTIYMTPNAPTKEEKLPSKINVRTSLEQQLPAYENSVPNLRQDVKTFTSTSAITDVIDQQSPKPIASIFGGYPVDSTLTSANTFNFGVNIPSEITVSVVTTNSGKSLPVTAPSMPTISCAPVKAEPLKVTSSIFGGFSVDSIATSTNSFTFGMNRPLQKPDTNPEAGSTTLFGSNTLSGPFFNTTRDTSQDAGDSNEDVDEYEPTIDFKPVIDMPDLVPLNTGEQNDDILFEDRAKIYRYDDLRKEWKERGVGVLKILKNRQTGKSRIVMRRDQTLKTCANHVITSDMELSWMKKSERAFLWHANDYADEELKQENLSARFKTDEIAKRFKSEFDSAVANASKICPPEAEVSASPKTCDDITSNSQLLKSLTNLTVQNETVASTPKASIFGGFSIDSITTSGSPFVFGMESVTKSIAPTTSLFGNLSTGNVQPIPFSFGVKSDSSEGNAATGDPPKLFFNAPVNVDDNDESYNESVEEYEPDVDFKPVIDMPDLVEKNTGEENEENLFAARAKLYRYEKTTKEYKERGLGEIKILQNGLTGKYRIVMRRDQTHKMCANHLITPEMKLKPMETSENAWVWHANDFADEEVKPEQLCVRFKTKEIAEDFKANFEAASKPSSMLEVSATAKETFNTSKSDLAKKFQPSVVSSVMSTPVANMTPNAPIGTPFMTPTGTGNITGTCFGQDASTTFTFVTSTPGTTATTIPAKLFNTPSVEPYGDDQDKSQNESVEEFVPNVEFEPVITLPDFVETKTGEEDEEKLFGARAKLYRFEIATKQYKERGLGEIKILKNKLNGKFRIVMRREVTLKMCANHVITPEMKLIPNETSENVWIWHANDYADEEMKSEQLCVRFKTKEIAEDFRTNFEGAFKDSNVTEEVASAPTPKNDQNPSVQTLTPIQSETPISSIPSIFGGKYVSQSDDNNLGQIATASTISESSKGIFGNVTFNTPFDSSKNSIFGNPVQNSSAFSIPGNSIFAQSSNLTNGAPSIFGGVPTSGTNVPASFKFETTDMFKEQDKLQSFCSLGNTSFNDNKTVNKDAFIPQPLFKSATPARVEKAHNEDDSDVEGDFQPTVDFKPVIDLPNLVQVETGEENQEIMFEERAKIFRFDDNIKEFKERGVGVLRILKNEDLHKCRIVMRRDQTLKTCANHVLTGDMKLMPMITSEKAWIWSANDYADEELKLEKLVARFKTDNIAANFKKQFDAAVQYSSSCPPSTAAIIQSVAPPIKSSIAVKNPLPEVSPGIFGGFSVDSISSSGSQFTFGTTSSVNKNTTKSTSIFGGFSTVPSVKSDLAFSFGVKPQVSEETTEVKVLYKKQATPEQVARARELLLPDNFFMYQALPPCIGCIGCVNDDYYYSDVSEDENSFVTDEEEEELPEFVFKEECKLFIKDNDNSWKICSPGELSVNYNENLYCMEVNYYSNGKCLIQQEISMQTVFFKEELFGFSWVSFDSIQNLRITCKAEFTETDSVLDVQQAFEEGKQIAQGSHFEDPSHDFYDDTFEGKSFEE